MQPPGELESQPKTVPQIDLPGDDGSISKETLIEREALRRAEVLESRLRNLLNNLNVGVFRATLSGRIIEANPALLRILSVHKIEEIATEQIGALCNLGSIDRPNSTIESAQSDIRLVDTSGKEVWISLTRMTVQYYGETFIKGLVEDITLRKQNEKALRELNETLENRVKERTEALHISQQHLLRAERLASLGTLAAGIAHEINNPLNSILVLCDCALRKNNLEFSQKTFTTIGQETRRCSKIIRGVLQFAKNEQTTKTPHDLNDVIAHAIDLTNTYIVTPLNLKVDLLSEKLMVEMNPTEIEQVVVNIIKNAAEACPNGVEVEIRTERFEERAIILIRDSGPGIRQEIIGKVCDPFFSTRSEQGGTGLGLSVVHGIVSTHQGKLEVKSETGNGSLFRIDLPLCKLTNDKST